MRSIRLRSSSIVQEIVNRGGWSSGNAMVFIVTGTGHREAEAYEGESPNAPLLVINYTVEIPATPPAAPSGLTATTPQANMVHLAWTDNANNESGFELQRSTTGSGGPFNLL